MSFVDEHSESDTVCIREHASGNLMHNHRHGDVHISFHSGQNSTTGLCNTFIGGQTGASNRAGLLNTCVGYNAGNGNNGGLGHTFLGQPAGLDSKSGTNNIYINHPEVSNQSNRIRIGFVANQFPHTLPGLRRS